VLYRIDLSKTVSKWLGETEKILSQIFDLALDFTRLYSPHKQAAHEVRRP
jgi:SpoVK/Ycf46/Vps4 family AAA+-type ATPase